MTKKSNSELFSSILYVIIGILLVIFRSETLEWAMTIAGIVFLISGILDLVKKNVGKGRMVASNKEVVDFGKVIGKYVDPKTGVAYDTSFGTIHYSKAGLHVVPAKPMEWRK